MASPPRVIPSVYTRRNQEGDFHYMIKSRDYRDALFIFNDNERDHCSSRPGGGNAAIRPYNKYSGVRMPRSAGIPTGDNRGYASLTPAAKAVIDSSIEEIRELIREHGYQRVYFSADPDGKLGTSIFSIGDDVRDYITDQIIALGNL